MDSLEQQSFFFVAAFFEERILELLESKKDAEKSAS